MGEEFGLMERAMGFAALAILTVIPVLIVVAAADPAPARATRSRAVPAPRMN